MTIKVTYNVTDVYMTQSVSPVYINVSYSGGGTSGGGVWGTITGTLSNQTDLQNALNAKFDDPTGTTAQYLRGDGTLATFPSLTGYVPYTGATTNVDLGEYELKAGQLTLDVSPTGTAAVGTTRWNDTTGVSETTLKGGNVLLRNGVDLVARVVNKVTPNTTLTKAAYQAVRVSGAQGQRLAVAFAQANNDANSADTIGLVIETIPTNQEGFIMAVGQLENINTTGSLQGETWVDGDVLYLSPTTAGAITKVKPTGNGHIVVIGYVEYAHANNGKIYVKVMNGWELDELHDVSIVSVANNEALIYESSSALWKNKSISTALGYTPANAATTLTINGVTYDLSTSRTWTISAGISGSGTSGQVTYWSGASAVSGSNNLFWDNANGRLGIGTNVPTNNLEITRATGTTTLAVTSSGSGLDGRAVLSVYRIESGANTGWQFLKNESDNFVFRSIVGTSTVTERMTMYITTGNIGINTTSDLGQRLQVIGDTLLRGSGATSATTALTVQNSSSTNLFTVRNDGRITLATTPTIQSTTGNIILSSVDVPTRTLTYDTTNNTLTFSQFGTQAFIGARFQSPSDSTVFISPDGINATGSAKITAYDSSGNISLNASNNGNRSIVLKGLGSTGAVLIGAITTGNGTSYNAILRADSTTQGFMPPRMTTTQKNAIATPAAGLVVYDTTLNKLCVYTTAWETITSI